MGGSGVEEIGRRSDTDKIVVELTHVIFARRR